LLSAFCRPRYGPFEVIELSRLIYKPVQSTQNSHGIPFSSINSEYCQAALGSETGHLQLIGPFNSTGGWDSYSLSVNDLFTLSELLTSVKLFMSAFAVSIVDNHRAAIPYPPIHVHHAAIVPGRAISKSILLGCLVGQTCPGFLLGYAGTQGEFVCSEDEFPACLVRDLTSYCPSTGVLEQQPELRQFCRVVPSPLFAAAVLNDVRPNDATIMSYWLRFALRAFVDKAPVPIQAIHSPINIMSYSSLIQGSSTLMVPMDRELFSYYAFRMPAAGRLGHVYPHTHAIMCQEMILFSAPPIALGLDFGEVARDVLSLTGGVYLEALGYSKATIRKMLLARHRPTCNFTPWPSPDIQNLDGIAHSASCRPWSFEANDSMTTVAFFGLTRQVPKQMDNESEYEMHFYWQIYYYPSAEASMYGTAFTSSFLDAFDVQLSRRDILRAISMVWRRTTNSKNWAWEDATVVILITGLLICNPVLSLGLIVVYISRVLALTAHQKTSLPAGARIVLRWLCISLLASVSLWYALNVGGFREPISYVGSCNIARTPIAVALGTAASVWVLELGSRSQVTSKVGNLL